MNRKILVICLFISIIIHAALIILFPGYILNLSTSNSTHMSVDLLQGSKKKEAVSASRDANKVAVSKNRQKPDKKHLLNNQENDKNGHAQTTSRAGDSSSLFSLKRSILSKLKPQYPDYSIKHEEEGIVVLLIKVNPNKKLHFVKIIRSSGSYHLDNAAKVALKKVKLLHVLGVIPHALELSIPVEFKLQ